MIQPGPQHARAGLVFTGSEPLVRPPRLPPVRDGPRPLRDNIGISPE